MHAVFDTCCHRGSNIVGVLLNIFRVLLSFLFPPLIVLLINCLNI